MRKQNIVEGFLADTRPHIITVTQGSSRGDRWMDDRMDKGVRKDYRVAIIFNAYVSECRLGMKIEVLDRQRAL